MVRVVLVALLAALSASACRYSLEDDDGGGTPDGGGRKCTVSATVPACLAADQDMAASQKLGWIEQNIFQANCSSPVCHSPGQGGPPAGRVVLTMDSHDKLVNAASTLAPGRTLVVPGDVAKSYLMVLMQDLALSQADPSPAPAPRDGLYMPFNSPPVCCQKIDALRRWIEAGAQDD